MPLSKSIYIQLGSDIIGSSRGLVDKGVGLVMKFRVRIPRRSVVVLGSATNLKMLLCYKGTLQCCQHCRVPSITPEEKKPYRFPTWESRGSKK